jgi:hypothetical protein
MARIFHGFGFFTTKIIENYSKIIQNYFIGNYIRDDTDFILKDNYRQFRHQLLSIQGRFCFCSNEMQLCRIWRAKQN